MHKLTTAFYDFKSHMWCMSNKMYFFTGVLMFDEMSVRKSVHIRESDMTLLGKVNFAEHTRPSDCEKDGDHVLSFSSQCVHLKCAQNCVHFRWTH